MRAPNFSVGGGGLDSSTRYNPRDVRADARLNLTARNWGHRLVTLALLLSAVSGHWSDVGIPVPLDRAALAIGLFLSWLEFRRDGGRLLFRPVHLFMLLTLAWAALSALAVGTSSGEGLFALIDRLGVLPFLLFTLAPAVYRSEAQRRFLARALTLFGLYLGTVSVAQMVGPDALVWPRYILDPSVGIHVDRARGPFVESVANGLMLGYSATFAVLTLARDPGRAWRGLALVTLPLCAAGLLLTLTRAVWLGAAAAVLVAAATLPHVRRWVVPAGLLAALLGAVLLISLPQLAAQTQARTGDQFSVWDRLNTNNAAVRIVTEHPLTGVGWNRSADRILEFVRQGPDYPVTAAQIEIHNVFLSRAAELGLPGAALWLAAFTGAVLFPLARRPERSELLAWRAALLPILVLWTTAAMLGPLPYPQPNYLLWLVGGVVLSSYLTAGQPESTESLQGRPPALASSRRWELPGD